MFHKFRLSKNDRKERRLGVHDFPSKLFCFTVSKLSVKEPFCAVFKKLSGSGKVNGEEGMEFMKIFRQKFFVSQYRKVFLVKSFRVSFISGIKKR